MRSILGHRSHLSLRRTEQVTEPNLRAAA